MSSLSKMSKNHGMPAKLLTLQVLANVTVHG